ncbi:MAG: ABC transporter ATP-binding protein, partial [Phycisphaerae bacterium]
ELNLIVLIAFVVILVIKVVLSLGAGLFVFANLLQEFANQVGQITNIANSIQSSLASAERVFEVLDEPIRITAKPDAVRLNDFRGAIEFEDVCFAYGEASPVLQ